MFISKRYLHIAFVNLFIVSCLGVILRYKIAFSLPFIDQKFILHAHSHFAFAGWITHAIMCLMVNYLEENHSISHKKYKWLLNANLVTAYGMLLSFPVQGYGFISILFSTLSIFVSYAFAWMFWKDLNKTSSSNIVHSWFKASLAFLVISSIGAFSLAYMLATKNIEQHIYLSTIYFFLHFQYNGWFFFACMGIAGDILIRISIDFNNKNIFRFFLFACIPAYFLSVPWLTLPVWAHIIIVIAAILQAVATVMFVKLLWKHREKIKMQFSPVVHWLFTFSILAFCIKILLQTGSGIPALSKIAFGLRPIVIGYLHLILLGMISLFLIGCIAHVLHLVTVKFKISATIFCSGIIINEILLMTQGILAITYNTVPYINEMLLAAALLIFFGFLLLNLGIFKRHAFGHNFKN